MKLFGMDHKSFFISVFARQKELNALTSQPKGERKKMVLRLLGIENVDEAIKQIREDARYAKNAIQSARDDLFLADGSSAIEELEKELEELALQENKLAAAKKALDSDIKNIENIHNKLKKALASQEAEAKKLARLEASIKGAEAKFSGLEEQKDELSQDLKQLEKDGIAIRIIPCRRGVMGQIPIRGLFHPGHRR